MIKNADHGQPQRFPLMKVKPGLQKLQISLSSSTSAQWSKKALFLKETGLVPPGAGAEEVPAPPPTLLTPAPLISTQLPSSGVYPSSHSSHVRKGRGERATQWGGSR